MTDTKALIDRAYAAFNARDVEGALALMTDDVSWPKASEGGSVVGKEAIRAYWMRQWAEFDPHVEPLDALERDGKTHVRVRQVVKTRDGGVLFDGEVGHVYTIANGLIVRMELSGADGESGPSDAFARHPDPTEPSDA